MNQSGVLTTKEERNVFIGKDYKTPHEACEVIARLDYRNWYNRKSVYALVCNFTTESGEKLALFAFRRRRPYVAAVGGDAERLYGKRALRP